MKFDRNTISFVLTRTIVDNGLPCAGCNEDDYEFQNETCLVLKDAVAVEIDESKKIDSIRCAQGLLVRSEDFYSLVEQDCFEHEFRECDEDAELQDYIYWRWLVYVSFVDLTGLSTEQFSFAKVSQDDAFVIQIFLGQPRIQDQICYRDFAEIKCIKQEFVRNKFAYETIFKKLSSIDLYHLALFVQTRQNTKQNRENLSTYLVCILHDNGEKIFELVREGKELTDEQDDYYCELMNDIEGFVSYAWDYDFVQKYYFQNHTLK